MRSVSFGILCAGLLNIIHSCWSNQCCCNSDWCPCAELHKFSALLRKWKTLLEFKCLMFSYFEHLKEFVAFKMFFCCCFSLPSWWRGALVLRLWVAVVHTHTCSMTVWLRGVELMTICRLCKWCAGPQIKFISIKTNN